MCPRNIKAKNKKNTIIRETRRYKIQLPHTATRGNHKSKSQRNQWKTTSVI